MKLKQKMPYILMLLLFIAIITLVALAQQALFEVAMQLKQERERLNVEIMLLEAENAQLRDLLSELRGQQGELQKRVEELLDVWQVDEFDLTFYTLECGYPWDDGYTYTETLATPGRTIAVDPSVIPLGSWVWIEGFGWRRAEDIGGKVKKNVVDMYVGAGKEAYAEAMRGGRQRVRVAYQQRGVE